MTLYSDMKYVLIKNGTDSLARTLKIETYKTLQKSCAIHSVLM